SRADPPRFRPLSPGWRGRGSAWRHERLDTLPVQRAARGSFSRHTSLLPLRLVGEASAEEVCRLRLYAPQPQSTHLFIGERLATSVSCPFASLFWSKTISSGLSCPSVPGFSPLNSSIFCRARARVRFSSASVQSGRRDRARS